MTKRRVGSVPTSSVRGSQAVIVNGRKPDAMGYAMGYATVHTTGWQNDAMGYAVLVLVLKACTYLGVRGALSCLNFHLRPIRFLLHLFQAQGNVHGNRMEEGT